MPELSEVKTKNEIRISFESKPPQEILKQLKENGFKWDGRNKYWYAKNSSQNKNFAENFCSPKPYGLKLTTQEVVEATDSKIKEWVALLEKYIRKVMPKKNKTISENLDSQKKSWEDCFKFIRRHLKELDLEQQFEMVFEYSLPETFHQRPDVLILTNSKVICLEFKRKDKAQQDNYKDDVEQVQRYDRQLRYHHKITQDFDMQVVSYLVCTQTDKVLYPIENVEILSEKNFSKVISSQLSNEVPCSFSDNWINSVRVEVPDMIRAIRALYRDKKIPYISDVNKKCLDKILEYINKTQNDKTSNHKKILIFVNGVPGSGKTAVAQTIAFEENKHGEANAVYLAGNGALIEVLQYEIDEVSNKGVGENVIHGMKNFSEQYFDKTEIPEQSIVIFDEAQRAWDSKRSEKKYSQPMELLNVGDRIAEKRDYAVVVAFYGDGQFIENGEEKSLELWADAINEHQDWDFVVSDKLSGKFPDLKEREYIDYDMYLRTSLRADFVNVSKWAELTVCRENASFYEARSEYERLKDTPFQIFISRDRKSIERRMANLKQEHSDWKYGFIISNFADRDVVQKSLKGWTFGKKGKNSLWFGEYGSWYTDNCKTLDKACSVYGNQGLELDCPIVVFGGDYIRKNKKWIPAGWYFEHKKTEYEDMTTVIENNYRVLLTRARKEMILLIPDDPSLDETFEYFKDMGIHLLP